MVKKLRCGCCEGDTDAWWRAEVYGFDEKQGELKVGVRADCPKCNGCLFLRIFEIGIAQGRDVLEEQRLSWEKASDIKVTEV